MTKKAMPVNLVDLEKVDIIQFRESPSEQVINGLRRILDKDDSGRRIAIMVGDAQFLSEADMNALGWFKKESESSKQACP